jgi:hypothetical protein
MSTLSDGIVGISGLDDGEPEGASFLIDGKLVVTCAHVVNAALGRLLNEQSCPAPAEQVAIRFCALPGAQQTLMASVAGGR